MTAVVYGAPIYLEAGADKDAAREFDFTLVEAIAGLFEVTMTHIVAAAIGLRAIEGARESMPVDWVVSVVRAVHAECAHPYFEPLPAAAAIRGSVVDVLRYFERHGMLRVDGAGVVIDVDAVRREPPLDSSYRKRNPVKFLCNQILHLGVVLRAVEQAMEQVKTSVVVQAGPAAPRE
jgi:hypothetical protein